MKITNLEKMERIVDKNKNLFWDGWTVVSFYPSESARTSNKGSLINGKWSILSKYTPNRDGWNIPDKFLR
jgi:hypothetical protein